MTTAYIQSIDNEIHEASEKLGALIIQRATAALTVIRQAEKAAIEQLNEYVPTERLLLLEEAAAYLRMSPRSLDEGTRPGREPVMPFLIQGGRKKFRKASLDAELEQMEVRAAVRNL